VTYLSSSGEDRAARFGFIVSRKVGSAVVRNTVRRRLKAVCAEALPSVPPGSDIVIRVLPNGADAAFADLRTEVTRCLARSAA
jgi:ribonuclease P protein component